MMEPRFYQLAAVAAFFSHLYTRLDNACIEIPTGGGKTLIIALIAARFFREFGKRVLVITHVKELVQQNAAALRASNPDIDVGVYSAGLKSRDHANSVVVASIQSLAGKACHFSDCGLVIIDEAHRIQPKEKGQYNEFIAAIRRQNSGVRIGGTTATAYRMTTGALCGPEELLNHICYRIGVAELVAAGFLSPVKSKQGLTRDLKFDDLKIDQSKGDFEFKQADALMTSVVTEAVSDVLNCTSNDDGTPSRHSVLLFCQSRAHAQAVQQEFARVSVECAYLDGKTPNRDEIIAGFRSGALRFLVNVDVLTTGFDSPNIDCVAILRPTASAGLYYQMVGRGFRKSDGKTDCLILDFGGNVERHGPVDLIDPVPLPKGPSRFEPKAKACPSCRTLVALATTHCSECGHAFHVGDEATHDPTASELPVLSELSEPEQITGLRHVFTVERLEAAGVKWKLLRKRPLSLAEFANLIDIPLDTVTCAITVQWLFLSNGKVTWDSFCHLIGVINGSIDVEVGPRVAVTVVNVGRKFWYMRYKDPLTGKFVSKSTEIECTKEMKPQAKAKAAQWQDELLAGPFKAASKTLWPEFRARYESDVLSRKAIATRKRAADVFNAIESMLDLSYLSELSSLRLADFKRRLRDERGLAEATVKTSMAHLHAALNWARDAGILSDVPTCI